MSNMGASTQTQEQNRESFESKAKIALKSAEDEKIINHAKLKAAYFASLKEMLALESYKDWQMRQQDNEASDSIVISSGLDQVYVQYTQDGIEVSLKNVNEKSIEIMLESVKRYHQCYEQHHKSTVEFTLTCNDEDEAEKIIAASAKKHVKVSKLYFYNPKTGEKPIPQDGLLQKLRHKLGLDKKSKKLSTKR